LFAKGYLATVIVNTTKMRIVRLLTGSHKETFHSYLLCTVDVIENVL